jgi:hypothetical protein
MTYYRIINGIRYERSLLASAVEFEKSGNRISEPEIKRLYQQAHDKGAITEIEKRTLLYISRNYKLTDNARSWLHEALDFRVPNEVELAIKAMRKRFGLNNMAIDIAPAIVDAYEQNSTRSFESALTDAIEALLHGGNNVICLQNMVARVEPEHSASTDQRTLLLSYLNRGRLYLLSPDDDKRSAMAYDEPDYPNFEYFWIFGFVCPDLEPLVFYSYVLRQQVSAHSKGQFSKKADLDVLTEAVIRKYGGYENMQWVIPVNELRAQLAKSPNQNFGNSLFAAIDSGIYNRESSTSMGDAISQEIWLKPGTTLRQRQMEYADSGVLFLIPSDYETQPVPGFPIPDQFEFNMDYDWVFGLSMPALATFDTLLTATRERNDGSISWSDTFFDLETPVEQQITQVINGIFGLEGLRYEGKHASYLEQVQQWGFDFQRHPALLRQCLDALLLDDSPGTALHAVAKRDFDQAEDPKEAIRERMLNYLNNAVITLMPDGTNEPAAPNGESIEEYWLFRVVIPDLADHYLWVIIPRFPEDGQLPYQYWS